MLDVGQQVKIIASNDKEEKVFSAKISEMGKKTFFVDLPSFEVGFVKGQKLEIHMFRFDSRYEFVTKVKGKKMDNIVLLELEKPQKNKVKRIQLRDYFRVRVNFNMMIKAVNNEKKMMKVNLLDISGGGLAFLYRGQEEEFESGTNLFFELTMPDEEGPIDLLGEVTRAAPLKNNADTLKVGVKFLNITENERNVIMRYCFQRQLELRKKGML